MLGWLSHLSKPWLGRSSQQEPCYHERRDSDCLSLTECIPLFYFSYLHPRALWICTEHILRLENSGSWCLERHLVQNLKGTRRGFSYTPLLQSEQQDQVWEAQAVDMVSKCSIYNQKASSEWLKSQKCVWHSISCMLLLISAQEEWLGDTYFRISISKKENPNVKIHSYPGAVWISGPGSDLITVSLVRA